MSDPAPRSSGALKVAGGILSSRLFGFVRDAVMASYFGAGPYADVFRTALRGPNALQNLLGEQTLSASFIPVYSRRLREGRPEAAGRFAGAVFGLLLAVAGGLALVGVVLAEPIVAVLAPGYLADAAAVAAGSAEVDRYRLTVAAVRFIFPMTAVLVLSAWCLGILNSHRRLFLPYVAPVAWNAAIIAAFWLVGEGVVRGASPASASPPAAERILMAGCVGALVGGVLQFLVQLPAVLREVEGLRLALSTRVEGVREALAAFGPLVAGRGVIQISGYLDLLLASLLAAGAVSALGYAQTLYLLPVSLFGMSLAAAELPELSRRTGREERSEVAVRVDAALRQMAFLTVPTAVGYLVFGDLLVAALFGRGDFGPSDTRLVYLVLCGYSLGLLAANSSRLLNNVFFSLLQTRIPAWIAVRRVVVALAVGVPLMFWLDRFAVPVADPGGLRLGALGLALAAGLAAWVELALLLRRLRELLPELELPGRVAGRMLLLAAAVAPPAWGVELAARRLALPDELAALAVVATFAVLYLLLSWLLGLPEARAWARRIPWGKAP